MADYTTIDLSKYRLQRAKEDLSAGINALNNGDFRLGANRAYYAIFHSARAVLILEGLDYKKHSAVIASFRQNFVKTGIFSAEISKIIGRAFEIRTEADYEDFFIISKKDVEKQLKDAERFINQMEAYLNDKY
ncbi:MAG: HEPN domain-containing protein [Oscillospiraceae bacterium]|nr:HEPN domain-containing protein [Oscillospiraceae bacterium]